MRRRTFVSIASTGAIMSLAGCSSDEPEVGGSSENELSSDTQPTQSESADNEPTQSTQSDSSNNEQTKEPEASFEVVEYNLPETVAIDSSVSGNITVRNVGDAAGGATTQLYVQTPDSDWSVVNEYEIENLEAGGTTELSVEMSGFNYIDRYELALGNSDKTAVIQTVSAEIDWGNEYTTPDGYVIRIDRPELQDTYTTEGFDGKTEESPDNRGQWAFANVYVKNETGQSSYSPTGFSLITGSSQYDSRFILSDPINKGEKYDSGDLQPGIERSGWLAYELPENLSVSDLTMAWSTVNIGGEISVNWS